ASVVMRQTPGAATGLQTFSGSLSALGVRSGAVTTPYREPFVGESVSLFREPDAGNLPVRFDEREQETGSSQTGLRGRGRKPGHPPTGRLSSLRLFSTLLSIALKIPPEPKVHVRKARVRSLPVAFGPPKNRLMCMPDKDRISEVRRLWF